VLYLNLPAVTKENKFAVLIKSIQMKLSRFTMLVILGLNPLFSLFKLTIKSIFLLPVFGLFLSINIHAQVKLKDGKVYQNDTIIFLYKEQKTDKITTYYEFNRKDKTQLFDVIKTSYMGMKGYRVTFPTIDTYFEVNYGNAAIEEVVTSYINNKIIETDLKINKSALESYAKTRGIYLKSLSKLGTLKTSENATTYTLPSTTGSTTQNTSASSAPSSTSFSLTNTSNQNVKIFIGDKPKYGSGTTGNVSGNSIERRTAKVGDQICIVDASDNPISCMTVTASMGDVVINKSGTGFGY
jgi:hypothetical protein